VCEVRGGFQGWNSTARRGSSYAEDGPRSDARSLQNVLEVFVGDSLECSAEGRPFLASQNDVCVLDDFGNADTEVFHGNDNVWTGFELWVVHSDFLGPRGAAIPRDPPVMRLAGFQVEIGSVTSTIGGRSDELKGNPRRDVDPGLLRLRSRLR
jgi:hypothetical protein